MKDAFFYTILRRDQTVFTFRELLLLWGKSDTDLLKSRMSYYIKRGYLYHIRRGIYAKDKNYNRFELATKLYTPSYISFETVLLRAGVTFQYYETIFVASYQTKEIESDGQLYAFKSLKGPILTCREGIEFHSNYAIATPERAFLDTVYLYKRYYFDNLSSLDWEKVYDILPIYENKRMELKVAKYHQQYKNDRKEPDDSSQNNA